MDSSGSVDSIWEVLSSIPDPEIPVISIVELGMVRGVELLAGGARVTLAPTYSACPALFAIRQEIVARLGQAGVAPLELVTSLAPPWSTDWITPEGRRKLHAFGLAPPGPACTAHLGVDLPSAAVCPQCGASDTRLANSFGPTLCRAIFVCNACGQPFEAFKPL